MVGLWRAKVAVPTRMGVRAVNGMIWQVMWIYLQVRDYE